MYLSSCLINAMFVSDNIKLSIRKIGKKICKVTQVFLN